MKTFILHVAGGLVCTLEAPDEPPPQGRDPNIRCKWSSRPPISSFEEYKAFILKSYKAIIDDWKRDLLYVLPTPTGAVECWLFKPGVEPKRGKVTEMGFLELPELKTNPRNN